jgi:hypothetical protein
MNAGLGLVYGSTREFIGKLIWDHDSTLKIGTMTYGHCQPSKVIGGNNNSDSYRQCLRCSQ